ncbi:MAG: hypothetical protein HOP30_15920 [Cyclobacteriaceae bacterium]|nr:hypothetical protein [Cyclobacteriaceae bacterium]
MKAFYVLTIFTIFSFSASAETKPNEENSLKRTQVTFLESGINLTQCKNIRDRLSLDPKSCGSLEAHYVPFLERAKKVVDRLPEKMRTGQDAISVKKVADILKEFPETTDSEMLGLLTKQDER